MIYTSSFKWAQHSQLEIETLNIRRIVSIELKPPSGWPEDNQAYSLRPLEFMDTQYRKHDITDYGYASLYIDNRLKKNITPGLIAEMFDHALLCGYAITGFCLRHVIRAWLENAGIESMELGYADNYQLEPTIQGLVRGEKLLFLPSDNNKKMFEKPYLDPVTFPALEIKECEQLSMFR